MSNHYFPSRKDGHSTDVNLNLSSYATKSDLKNLNVDTSSFVLKTNLTGLKTKVDDLKTETGTFSATTSKIIGVVFLMGLASLLLL